MTATAKGRCVIRVDLADVYAAEDKKVLLRTLCWGDEAEDVDEKRLCLRTTSFETGADGSIRPVSEPGFVVPSAASGVGPSEVVAAKGRRRGTSRWTSWTCSRGTPR